MNKISFRNKTALVGSTLLLAGFPLGFSGLADVSVTVSGSLGYPDMVPGNLSSASYNNSQGPIPGNYLSGSLSRNGSGSTVDSVSGESSFAVSASATPGLLLASGSAQAQCTPNPDLSPFIDGFATIFAQANFSDTVTVYNPSLPLSAPVQVRMTLDVAWSGTGFIDGNRYISSVSSAEMHFGGNGSSIGVIDSDYALDGVPADTKSNGGGFFLVTVPNGLAQNVSGQLQITAQAGLRGSSTDTVAVSTYSNVVSPEGARFSLEGVLPDTEITAGSGHDYSPVPEPGAYGVAGGVLLAGWGLVRRARRGGSAV